MQSSPHCCYISCPSHFTYFDISTSIWRRVQLWSHSFCRWSCLFKYCGLPLAARRSAGQHSPCGKVRMVCCVRRGDAMFLVKFSGLYWLLTCLWMIGRKIMNDGLVSWLNLRLYFKFSCILQWTAVFSPWDCDHIVAFCWIRPVYHSVEQIQWWWVEIETYIKLNLEVIPQKLHLSFLYISYCALSCNCVEFWLKYMKFPLKYISVLHIL